MRTEESNYILDALDLLALKTEVLIKESTYDEKDKHTYTLRGIYKAQEAVFDGMIEYIKRERLNFPSPFSEKILNQH